VTNLQASLKDKAAKTWRERCVSYRVGSYMKGCRYCGDIELVETKSGRLKEVWKSGFNVYRAYRPWETRWTWKCEQCGSVDAACWDQSESAAAQLGKEPILGAAKHNNVAVWKDGSEDRKVRPYHLREEAMTLFKKKPAADDPLQAKIRELELKIKQLEALKK
jgi:hypothetical protein